MKEKIKLKPILLSIVVLLAALMLASCNGKEENKSDGAIADDGLADINRTENQKSDVGEEEPKPEDSSLEELRETLLQNEAVLGVAYLGYTDGTFDDITVYLEQLGLHEKYPFVKAFESGDFVSLESNELYLVVPASEDACIGVYGAKLNENSYMLEKDGLITEMKDGKPFILACNISEIVPNVVLETDQLLYSPSLSGMDGSVVTAEGIYDFSLYEEINGYFGFTQ